MKNKRGDLGDLLAKNIIYLLIALVFAVTLMIFVNMNANGAGVWEDFYAKEIAGKIVNLAQIGDEITLNVQKGSEIAVKSGVSLNNAFMFDNKNNEFCVKLKLAGSTCFSYFRNIQVEKCSIKLGLAEGSGNTINFVISDKKDNMEKVRCIITK